MRPDEERDRRESEAEDWAVSFDRALGLLSGRVQPRTDIQSPWERGNIQLESINLRTGILDVSLEKFRNEGGAELTSGRLLRMPMDPSKWSGDSIFYAGSRMSEMSLEGVKEFEFFVETTLSVLQSTLGDTPGGIVECIKDILGQLPMQSPLRRASTAGYPIKINHYSS